LPINKFLFEEMLVRGTIAEILAPIVVEILFVEQSGTKRLEWKAGSTLIRVIRFASNK